MEQKNHKRTIRAWVMYDWANSAFATTIMAAVLPVYYAQVAAANLEGNLPQFIGHIPVQYRCWSLLFLARSLAQSLISAEPRKNF